MRKSGVFFIILLVILAGGIFLLISTERSKGAITPLSFETFGNVTLSNEEYILTESGSNSGIFASINNSKKGVAGVIFQYKFIKAGDGDYLGVWLRDTKTNDNSLVYIGPDLNISREGYIDGEADYGMMHGADQLIFKLISKGDSNAILSLKSIRFFYSPLHWVGKTMKDCDKLTDISEKDSCSTYVVLFNKKEIIEEGRCEKITYENDRMLCYKMQGIQNKDLELCEKSGDYKNACYLEIAGKNPDITICDKMDSGTLRDDCYKSVAVTLGDYKICDKVGWLLGSLYCLRDVGIKTKDTTVCDRICDKITTCEYMKQECYDGITQ